MRHPALLLASFILLSLPLAQALEPLPSCFQGEGGYYAFQDGIVFSNFQTEKAGYAPLETVEIDYILGSAQQAPIVQAFTRTQIFYNHPEQGEIMLDESFGEAKQSIYLMDQDALKKEIRWSIPEGYPSGEYTAKAYVLSGTSFNLAGLSFVPYGPPGVPGTLTNFKIDNSRADSYFYFDKLATKLNGQPYKFSSFAPIILPEDGIKIETELANVGASKQADVKLELYKWDDVSGQPLTASSLRQAASLAENGKQAFMLSAANLEAGTYEAVLTATDGTRKAMLKMRISVAGSKLRLNYAGIDSFPLEAGKEAKAFVCFGNSADSITPTKGSVELELRDEQGNTVFKEKSDVMDVLPSPSGMAGSFTPDRLITNGRLIATVYGAAGQVDDQAIMDYDYSKFPVKSASLVAAAGKDTFAPNEPITYSINFADGNGIPLTGNLLVYITATDGSVARIAPDVGVSGQYVGQFDGFDQEGNYKLSVREKARGLSQDNAIKVGQTLPWLPLGIAIVLLAVLLFIIRRHKEL
ncbi:MAG: hypothetical protein HY519_00205 [Candidatus Aenigmarchaeota archaeon]|nr:hypothetical protein [Candidatus Aenigmarchaeota archaeon]